MQLREVAVQILAALYVVGQRTPKLLGVAVPLRSLGFTPTLVEIRIAPAMCKCHTSKTFGRGEFHNTVALDPEVQCQQRGV
jgi:hypothetical protein